MSNIRPITVSDMLANILERYVHQELTKLFVPNLYQLGFRPRHSTSQAVFLTKEISRTRLARNKPTYLCALDASKAFDKINLTILFRKLHGHLNPRTSSALRRYYEGAQAYVVNGKQESNKFSSTIGTKQGGPYPDLSCSPCLSMRCSTSLMRASTAQR